jgi:hypothetical protein
VRGWGGATSTQASPPSCRPHVWGHQETSNEEPAFLRFRSGSGGLGSGAVGPTPAMGGGGFVGQPGEVLTTPDMNFSTPSAVNSSSRSARRLSSVLGSPTLSSWGVKGGMRWRSGQSCCARWARRRLSLRQSQHAQQTEQLEPPPAARPAVVQLRSGRLRITEAGKDWLHSRKAGAIARWTWDRRRTRLPAVPVLSSAACGRSATLRIVDTSALGTCRLWRAAMELQAAAAQGRVRRRKPHQDPLARRNERLDRPRQLRAFGSARHGI